MANADRKTIVTELILWLSKERQLDQLPEVIIQPDTSLTEEGVFDSIKILQLVAWLEDTYKIKVGVEEMLPTSFETPQAIADMVMRLRAS